MSEMTVLELVKTKCETSGLTGLSRQIAARLMLSMPAASVLDITQHVVMAGGSTIPYLQRDAGEALIAAIKEQGFKPQLIHALRVLPQQYAVWQWYLQHRCGIPLAATPGNSPHERGIAIDINRHEDWISVLRKHNWQWRGKPDPGHFSFRGQSDPDFDRYGIIAFQRLWNSHTEDQSKHLTTDGVIGPKTLSALKISPSGGFLGAKVLV